MLDRKNGGIAWECNRTEIRSQEDRVAAELFKALNATPIRPRAQCQVWSSGYRLCTDCVSCGKPNANGRFMALASHVTPHWSELVGDIGHVFFLMILLPVVVQWG